MSKIIKITIIDDESIKEDLPLVQDFVTVKGLLQDWGEFAEDKNSNSIIVKCDF